MVGEGQDLLVHLLPLLHPDPVDLHPPEDRAVRQVVLEHHVLDRLQVRVVVGHGVEVGKSRGKVENYFRVHISKKETKSVPDSY